MRLKEIVGWLYSLRDANDGAAVYELVVCLPVMEDDIAEAIESKVGLHLGLSQDAFFFAKRAAIADVLEVFKARHSETVRLIQKGYTGQTWLKIMCEKILSEGRKVLWLDLPGLVEWLKYARTEEELLDALRFVPASLGEELLAFLVETPLVGKRLNGNRKAFVEEVTIAAKLAVWRMARANCGNPDAVFADWLGEILLPPLMAKSLIIWAREEEDDRMARRLVLERIGNWLSSQNF